MPRRKLKLLSVLPVALFATLLPASPVHLRTNALEQPIGIGAEPPRFSWQGDAVQAGWKQTAYQVMVASSEQGLRGGRPDVWDSGRTTSSESVNVVFKGAPLHASTRYFWQVRTWGSDGKDSVSPVATFETGLLADADWRAQWITRRDPLEADEMQRIRWIWMPGSDARQVPASTPAHFRYRFKLDRVPFAASLHVMARGKFVARINGHETGHHNEWSAFDREEALPYLQAGENTVEIDLTSPKIEKEAGAPASLAASLRLGDEKGGYRALVTDGSWQVSASGNGDWKNAQVVGPISEPFGLGVDRKTAMPGPDRIATGVSRFRTSFPLKTQVQSARLTITALGAYKAFLNGKPVAQNVLLTPGFTDFKRRALYQTYDVTGMLQQGQNALGVLLGGGWYSSPMTWTGFRYTPGPNLLRAQLDVTLADGSHQTIATGPGWQTASSATDFAEIYGGESHDARLSDASWAANGTAAGWAAATVAKAPNGVQITAEPDLPIHHTQTLQPVHLDPANAAHGAIFDMGQNMVGNVRLHVHGSRGAIVRLRYAERLNPDGSIYTENLRNADATDTYTLNGSGDESWTPSFTFHGFRYVELTTLTLAQTVSAATSASIEGLVYNSLPATPSVRLTSSSEVLNRMNELGWWGQRGNFVSIPTDCPQRDERLGWMGDAGVFWRTGTFNFNIDAFSHKFLLDITDAQTPEGAFTDIAPDILKWGPGAPGWGDAGVFVPYATWLQYGDLSMVEQAWPAMERWMDFIAKGNPNFLRQKELNNNYADWLAPDPHTPKDLIGTAYWALVAHEMAEMATALHRDADAAKYRDLHSRIAAAYVAAWVKPDGSVEGDTQTSYAATLATGIAPDALRTAMVDRLVKKIAESGNHLSTGFLGTPFLLPVLDETGHSDLAFKLLLTETYPSWGYMVKKGATTWWERWNGDTGDPGMNSYNHYAFGSVMAWVYRRAAGIDTDAGGAGYHHLTVQPHFDASLPQLHVEYDSAYGTVVSDWQQSKHQFTLTLPPNTTATVTLPGKQPQDAGSGVHTYDVP